MAKNAVAFIFIVGFFAAIAYIVTMGGADWRERDALVYGRGSDSKKLDPIAVDDGESVKVIINVYETLVRVGFDNKLGPCLATEWQPLTGGKHGYDFTIRKGVKYHDGTDLTPETVKQSLERLITFEGAPYGAFYKSIKQVSVIDGRVRVETHEPDATLLLNLAMFPACIVSPAAVNKHGKRFGTKDGAAVGTGPFRFSRWVPDQVVVVERNEAYWGKKAGVSRIEFRTVADNTQRLTLLKNGDLSYMDQPNPQDLKDIRSNGNLVLKMRDRGKESSLLYLALNTQQPPFDNVKFRQAIAHALDKETIAGLYHGAAQPAELPVPPGIHGHSKKVLGLEHDLALARKLLAESGVTEREFTLVHMSNPRPYILNPPEVARAIAGSLEKIGLKIKIMPYRWRRYLDLVQKGEHQMCLLGWSTDNGDADNFLSTFYSSKNTKKGSALNVSFFEDKKMDDMLAEARRTVDPARRNEVLERLYRYATQQSNIVPLIYARDMIVHSKFLENVQLHPLQKKFLWPIRITAAEKARQKKADKAKKDG